MPAQLALVPLYFNYSLNWSQGNFSMANHRILWGFFIAKLFTPEIWKLTFNWTFPYLWQGCVCFRTYLGRQLGVLGRLELLIRGTTWQRGYHHMQTTVNTVSGIDASRRLLRLNSQGNVIFWWMCPSRKKPKEKRWQQNKIRRIFFVQESVSIFFSCLQPGRKKVFLVLQHFSSLGTNIWKRWLVFVATGS